MIRVAVNIAGPALEAIAEGVSRLLAWLVKPYPARDMPAMNIREQVCLCGQSLNRDPFKCDDCLPKTARDHCQVCGKGPLPPTDGKLCDRCWWAKQEKVA